MRAHIQNTLPQAQPDGASKPLNNRLPSDYESIGKALVSENFRGSKFTALIEKCALIGLIKQPIHFSRHSWGRKIA